MRFWSGKAHLTAVGGVLGAVEAAQRAAFAVGTTAIGAEFEPPPLAPIAQIDGVPRWVEDQRPSPQHMRQRSGIVLWVRRDLRKGDIAGRFDELSEVASWLPA